MAEITMQYWAAARDGAGCKSEPLTGATLDDVITAAGRAHGADFARLLGICSYLVDGAPTKRADAAALTLRTGSVIEVLPPFAGGCA